MAESQYRPDERDANGLVPPPGPSVRVRTVAALICASTTRDGRTCGESARFEAADDGGALGLARDAGWTFRLGAARCPRCGREGASYGKASGPWHRGTV